MAKDSGPHGRLDPACPADRFWLYVVIPLTSQLSQAIKLAKEYEKDGGGYENEAESKNEPRTGAPEAKPEAKKTQEVDSGPQNGEVAQDDKVEDAREPIEKLKANSGKKPAGKKDTRKAKTAKARKEKKTPTEGIRKSARVGSKRTAPVEDEAAEESEEETVKPKAPAKKARTTKK